MPEGPTIKVAADMLRAALLGQPILAFSSRFKKAAREDWQRKIEGASVTSVRAHGKHLFIDFSSGWIMYTHMLMWGAWHVYQQDEPWRKEERKARVVLATPDTVAVLFSAPVCELVHRDDLATHRTAASGPDLLADHFDSAEALRRLRDPEHAARELGDLVMDQTVVAGIGNILKSEILFRAGLHPRRLPDTLSHAEWDRFVAVARELMRVSYELGSFVGAFLPPEQEVEHGKFGYVYRRRGYPCLQCGTPIRMTRQGPLQRLTYYCPHCQPYVGSDNPDAAPERPRRRKAAVACGPSGEHPMG